MEGVHSIWGQSQFLVQKPDTGNSVSNTAGRFKVLSEVSDITTHGGHRQHDERQFIVVTYIYEHRRFVYVTLSGTWEKMHMLLTFWLLVWGG